MVTLQWRAEVNPGRDQYFRAISLFRTPCSLLFTRQSIRPTVIRALNDEQFVQPPRNLLSFNQSAACGQYKNPSYTYYL